MNLSVEGLKGDILQGYVQENVNWVFSAKDSNDSSRRVGLLFNNQPKGVTFDPPLSEGSLSKTVRLDWQPTEVLSNSERGIEVHMRDLDRCESLESDPSICQSLRSLPNYDEVVSYKWEIVSRDSDATSLNSSTATSSDCAGNGLQGILNGIQGIKSLSGGDMSGLGGITDMVGSLIGMGGKLMGNNPGC